MYSKGSLRAGINLELGPRKRFIPEQKTLFRDMSNRPWQTKFISTDENDSDEILMDHRLQSCRGLIPQAVKGQEITAAC
jgi:hypothetical protein